VARYFIIALLLALGAGTWGLIGCDKPKPEADAAQVRGPGEPVPYETDIMLPDPATGKLLYFATYEDARIYQARVAHTGN
jgi:hypothetical protein